MLEETAVISCGIFGLIIASIIRDVGQWPRRLCLVLLSAAIARAVLQLLEDAAIQFRAPLALYSAVQILSILVTPVPSLLMTAYFLYCCGDDWRKSAFMWIKGILIALVLILEFMMWLYKNPDITLVFQRGAGRLAYLCLSLPVIILAVDLTVLVRKRKRLSRAYQAAFLLCYFMTDFHQILLLELLLVSELVKSYKKQMEENVRQRMSIAILEMRPHFIYNTMMTIYSLCAQDPQKARQVTRNFTIYLRNNFAAIAQENTVPFEKELEHTRAYLAVEQARFEEKLFVEFDITYTLFRVPPLTLQPLVENAVKHGIDPDLNPLYIFVRNRVTDGEIIIIVEDTGPGFVPPSVPPSDNEPHIALDNIRERLRSMCGGTLTIEPRKESGTKVTIRIPEKTQNVENGQR